MKFSSEKALKAALDLGLRPHFGAELHLLGEFAP